MSKIQPGDKAPDFSLPADTGETISISGFLGTPVVVFFYPKDNTPGCTQEAVGFSENLDAFEELGVKIIGISPDSVASHEKFRSKHNLTVDLVSDEEKNALVSYGVWVDKNMYGRKYKGVQRSTVLIDHEGKVARVWPKVKVAGHVEDVLQAAKELVG